MNQICEGLKTKEEVIEETLDEYRAMYVKTQQEFVTLTNVRLLPPASCLFEKETEFREDRL